MTLKEYTSEEVAKHNNPDSLWVIIDGKVYDLTEFQEIHPGGKKILKRWAGKDASKQFHKYHEVERVMQKFGNDRRIGTLVSNSANGVVSNNKTSAEAPNLEPYGDMVPYGDPAWYQGYKSPYYDETHAALRAEVREFVEKEIKPYVDDWDEKGEIDVNLYKKFADQGYLAMIVGLKDFPKGLTNKKVKSVPMDKVDIFHELIVTDELSRGGSGGVVWNVVGGFSIGLPPVMRFGRPELIKRIVPGILDGDKRICLAITEPDAGSDVANITTTAEKTADGKHYIVNGMKKWITNSIWADYFTVAVRTGGEGMNGISMLLVEKDMPGIDIKRIHTQGMKVSGTGFISFDDVKVPVENLLGQENKGFKVIMTNFNHERLGVIMQANRFARLCVEESMKYAHKRETFGKPLIKHDVIRNKLGQMASRVEAGHSWLENLLYQYKNMGEEEAMFRLGGPIAGCKAFVTQTLEFCAREASQIFGGLSYTRGGRGGVIERLYREVRAYAIPGGSEEIMLDLSIRQAVKVNQHLGAKL
ncbi:hypothetical protein TRICI_004887 [Trichomonascus ciferrii]|uniref:Cytochrome b5 heme-binding domain-containing protein n=1 Tax=Trichomonascus ciferrii TaxID=44093 RepID=A0A642UXY9_9ASCO|nr:hypothetical protein TRICI_004887 [Trichomonascus ciferrii]